MSFIHQSIFNNDYNTGRMFLGFHSKTHKKITILELKFFQTQFKYQKSDCGKSSYSNRNVFIWLIVEFISVEETPQHNWQHIQKCGKLIVVVNDYYVTEYFTLLELLFIRANTTQLNAMISIIIHNRLWLIFLRKTFLTINIKLDFQWIVVVS